MRSPDPDMTPYLKLFYGGEMAEQAALRLPSGPDWDINPKFPRMGTLQGLAADEPPSQTSSTTGVVVGLGAAAVVLWFLYQR